MTSLSDIEEKRKYELECQRRREEIARNHKEENIGRTI